MSKIVLFYDGKCVVCAKEIEIYRKMDRANKLSYVDISSDLFNPSSVSIPEDRLNKFFNVQLEDGHFVEGVQSFIEIWKRLPSLNWAAQIASLKPIYWSLHLGYLIFAEIRPYLPQKKCGDGYCELKFRK
jgi:predicted DCC family thiol-disulfide oxidoreductase YuxK